MCFTENIIFFFYFGSLLVFTSTVSSFRFNLDL